MRKLLYILSCGLILAACTEKEHMDDAYRNIQMRAYIGEPAVTTKSEPVEAVPWRGTVPSNSYNLPVKLLFSLEKGVYSSVPTSTNFLPCHTTLTYNDNTYKDPDGVTYTPAGGSELTGQPKYPSSRDGEGNATPVYCSGLYPQEWDVAADGKSASIDVDGTLDIMYAPEISGSLDVHFGPQNYQHQLSWIKLYVCSTTHEASELWGNIEEVSIVSNNEVTIDLGTEVLTPTGSMVEYPTHTEAIPLETTVASVGSIFCAPAASYTVNIKTSNSNEVQSVEINAPAGAGSFKSGELYVLEVYFTTTEVKGACTLAQWEYQDEDLNVS